MPTKTQLANLKRGIAAHVAEGFSTREDIVGRFTEDPDEEEYGEVDEEAVERLVDQAIRAHHRKQARWTTPNDCDKLDAAFKALERRGVVARQNFTCCSTCGEAEIGAEMALVKDRGRRVIGYAFYHMQDTESAVDGGGIYIKYGATTITDENTRLIGQKIADALTAAGLKPDWDGDPGNAIRLRLKWRKRRADKLPKRK